LSDETVHAALRSSARLVAIEAPGGSGKTTQGASYARDVAASIETGRVLVSTHTHAACSIFDERTRGLGTRLEIRTIDSLISQITNAYHAGLDLPKDTATWARQNTDGYDLLAVKAAALLERNPAIAAALAQRYPVVICDEHQDSSGDRHAAIVALHRAGSRLRIFADPMQAVFSPKTYPRGCPPLDWGALTQQADVFERLDTPHRWEGSAPALGRWIMAARGALQQQGGTLDLRSGLPAEVSVVFADNSAYGNLEYRPSGMHRKPIDAFERSGSSMLILSRYNETTISLRPTFGRRIPIWEGHNRRH
jgi:DNA helicase-2/ATP-dependent DNA helicase PcrA